MLCESCVHFDITHSSVHMNWRFVSQGCPTLFVQFKEPARAPVVFTKWSLKRVTTKGVCSLHIKALSESFNRLLPNVISEI